MRTSIRIVGALYFQLAAILGAISLASFLSELNLLEWRGLFIQLLDFWAQVGRPVFHFFLSPLLKTIELMCVCQVTVPDYGLDYAGVGFMLLFSRLRGTLGGWNRALLDPLDDTDFVSDKRNPLRSAFKHLGSAIMLALRSVLIWPIEVLLMLRQLLLARRLHAGRSETYIRGVIWTHAYGLMPVFYCLFMIAGNWVLLAFPWLADGVARRQPTQP